MTTYFRIRNRKWSFDYVEVPRRMPAYAKPSGIHLTAFQSLVMIGFGFTMNCVELLIAHNNMIVVQYNALGALAGYLFNKLSER